MDKPLKHVDMNKKRSWKRRVSSRGRRSEEEKWLRLFETARSQPGGGGKKAHLKRSPPRGNNKKKIGGQQANMFHIKYKQELCNNHRETGWCRYGLNCNFAHGEEELRVNTDAGSRKINKKCMHYHGIGICMWGTRCRYIHDETEEEISQMSDPKKRGGAHTVEFPIPEITLPSETPHIPLYKRSSSRSI